jgi:glycosyltransferase involved in cell wall biosynthesis
MLISYHFPPSRAVGGRRIAHFSKYLPLFGWNPVVLTTKIHNQEDRDRSGFCNTNGAEVIRTSELCTSLEIYSALKQSYKKLFNKYAAHTSSSDNHIPTSDDNSPECRKPYYKLRRHLLSFLTRPDTETGWIFPAIARAIREIRRQNIPLVLTSCPPYSVHLIGLLLKLLTGVRWVADFRDPWITTVPPELFVNTSLSLKFEKWLEKKVITTADMVTTNTENLCQALSQTYQEIPSKRFLAVSNGFDTDLLSKYNNMSKYKKFTITYTGTLYLERSPEPLFSALSELLHEKKLTSEEVNLKLIGNCQFIHGKPIENLIRSYGLEHVVDVLPPVSYDRVLEILKRSHLALLLAPNQPFQIPTKAFDYIGVGTEILALTEEGATRDLVDQSRLGAAFYPSETNRIKEFLLYAVRNHQFNNIYSAGNLQKEFDVRHLVEQLARHLDTLTHQHY